MTGYDDTSVIVVSIQVTTVAHATSAGILPVELVWQAVELPVDVGVLESFESHGFRTLV